MHFVTEAYLSTFVDPEQSKQDAIWVFDKVAKSVRLQPLKDTAVIRRFYEFDLPDGTKDTSLETLFSRIESNTLPIIKRWCKEGAEPKVKEISDVAAFVACLFVRVPRTIQMNRAIASAVASVAIENVAADEERLRSAFDHVRQGSVDGSLTFEVFRELVTNFDDKFTVQVDQKYALSHSFRTLNVIYKRLKEMYWCLLDSRPYGGRFITCDAPVNTFLYREGKAAFGGGLAQPDVEINLPPSPYVCLSLSPKRNSEVRKVDAATTREINRRTAHQAERYIYSSANTRSVARIVDEGSITTSLPKIDTEEVKANARERLKFKK